MRACLHVFVRACVFVCVRACVRVCEVYMRPRVSCCSVYAVVRTTARGSGGAEVELPHRRNQPSAGVFQRRPTESKRAMRARAGEWKGVREPLQAEEMAAVHRWACVHSGDRRAAFRRGGYGVQR